jgi:hypothetical protein
MAELTGSFYIVISSIFCAGISGLMVHCFRLKFSSINCFGVSCSRNIELENENYQMELEHPLTPEPIRDIIPIPTIPNSRRNSQN